MDATEVAESLSRWLFHIGAVGVLLVAAVQVPVPVTSTAPAPPVSIPSLISVEDASTTPLNGRALLTAVVVSETSPVGVARGLLDPDVDLDLGNRVRGEAQEDFFQAEAVRFERSADLAVGVGARAAGVPVELTSAVFVTFVLPGAPARDILEPGDLITAVAGERVTSTEALEERLGDVGAGRPVTLTVRRGGTSRQVEIAPGPYEYQGRTETGFGILIQTVAADVDLPFPVHVEETTIGGSSAGLMIALTVYDLLAEEDLLAGRVVAGTGEIRPDGGVAAVAEVAPKVVAAERAGADVFLVPASQLATARAAAEEIEVTGVATLDQAIRALSGR